jgi:hypothetical protein
MSYVRVKVVINDGAEETCQVLILYRVAEIGDGVTAPSNSSPSGLTMAPPKIACYRNNNNPNFLHIFEADVLR